LLRVDSQDTTKMEASTEPGSKIGGCVAGWLSQQPTL
jgi:hypothetical protein